MSILKSTFLPLIMIAIFFEGGGCKTIRNKEISENQGDVKKAKLVVKPEFFFSDFFKKEEIFAPGYGFTPGNVNLWDKVSNFDTLDDINKMAFIFAMENAMGNSHLNLKGVKGCDGTSNLNLILDSMKISAHEADSEHTSRYIHVEVEVEEKDQVIPTQKLDFVLLESEYPYGSTIISDKVDRDELKEFIIKELKTNGKSKSLVFFDLSSFSMSDNYMYFDLNFNGKKFPNFLSVLSINTSTLGEEDPQAPEYVKTINEVIGECKALEYFNISFTLPEQIPIDYGDQDAVMNP